MLVLVSYDVMVTSDGGKRRLRRVAKECKNYGQRVQFSVFECNVDPVQWITMKNKLEKIIDVEKDSLRYYYLGSNWRNRVEHVGAKEIVDLEDTLIV